MLRLRTYWHMNENMSLCCWRGYWLLLFNIEISTNAKWKNYYQRLGLQSRRMKWKAIINQLPVVTSMDSVSTSCLPYSNEILIFQDDSISYTMAVFKEEHTIPTQRTYFDHNLNGFLTEEESKELLIKEKGYCFAQLMKWIIKKQRRIE